MKEQEKMTVKYQLGNHSFLYLKLINDLSDIACLKKEIIKQIAFEILQNGNILDIYGIRSLPNKKKFFLVLSRFLYYYYGFFFEK